MARAWSAALLIALCSAICAAKIINADTDASYAAKVQAGALQTAQWISDWVMPQTPARPPRKVQLALVGFGRTGSTSFSTGLKQLGYAPIHDDEAPEVADVYRDYMKGTMTLDEINVELGKRGFDAPMVSVHSYVEWAATAPGVKVILTVRDKKKWAQSWLAVTPAAYMMERRPFKWLKVLQDLRDFNREVMVNVPTNGNPELFEDLPTLEAGYAAWVAFVRKTVPKDRLLEFDVKQGWEPLCAFLGKPVPSTPFPRINDRVVVDTIIKVFLLITWVWPLLFASPFLLLWCCCRCCCGRKKQADNTKKRN